MSWGQPAIAAPIADNKPVVYTCEAPNCTRAATLLIMYGEETRKSCAPCTGLLPVVGVVEGAAYDEAARALILKAWEASKVTLELAKNTEMDLRKAAFGYCFPTPTEGTQRVDLGNGYALKAVHKLNVKITASNEDVDKAEDAARALGNEGQFLFERLITWTPNFSKSEYKKLEADNPTHINVKKLIDGLIEETPGAPTLEIEAPKAKLNG
jgi:hypothetical protein